MGDNSMKTNKNSPTSDQFLIEVNKLAIKFNWPTRSFERGSETVLVALIETDVTFERFVWVYDTERITLRCMLVGKVAIEVKEQTAFLELCARINEGLPFGCLEYSFVDRIFVFRDSADLDWGPLDKIIGGTTSRVLDLGQKYASAIKDTLQGEKPEKAVEKSEKTSKPRQS